MFDYRQHCRERKLDCSDMEDVRKGANLKFDYFCFNRTLPTCKFEIAEAARRDYPSSGVAFCKNSPACLSLDATPDFGSCIYRTVNFCSVQHDRIPELTHFFNL